jgi:hypothetical protein
MREEFFIERHGKRHVLYAGLLDEAHSRGLQSIDTDLIESPGEDNGQRAIVKANVVMRADSDEIGERFKTFTGIGDASPENVGRNIAPHIIRMAETRAKARALRDAINVGVTAFEELGGDEPGEAQKAPIPGQDIIDRETIDDLETLIRDVSGSGGLQRFVEKHGPLEELTPKEADMWIKELHDVLISRRQG